MPQEEALTTTLSAAAIDGVVDAAVRALTTAPGASRRIVIDGRSGSGKTTAAHRIGRATSARVVSLDEFYPGWRGLEAGTAIAEELVRTHAEGRVGEYHRWNWDAGEWDPETRRVDPRVPLVLEGCGSLTASTAARSAAAIWMDGDASVRRASALARDGETFAPFWEVWAEQEERHMAAHDPRTLATIDVDVA
ncbi:hypothetical protein [Microbacterium karelineae]|uniref:hypothetical protein n=1 Tax=Microbacterium karelineae TaxID=2654283 RepID=UPI0012EAE734|nr:hypothetical protein [Microbacterium karelineae]